MDRDTLDKKYGGSERRGRRVLGGREKKEEEEEERKKREQEKFLFWRASMYLLYHLPKNLNFSFFVKQQSKKVVRYSSSHISTTCMVYIDSFEKEKPPKQTPQPFPLLLPGAIKTVCSAVCAQLGVDHSIK